MTLTCVQMLVTTAEPQLLSESRSIDDLFSTPACFSQKILGMPAINGARVARTVSDPFAMGISVSRGLHSRPAFLGGFDSDNKFMII